MSLTQSLREYIAAGFSGIWINTHEHEDAMAEIARLGRDNDWSVASWDVDRGLQIAGAHATSGDEASIPDPLAAIHSVRSLASSNGAGLLVLPNFHRFLQSAEVIQTLWHAVADGRRERTFIVILSPVVQIPIELERQFVVIEHDLPDRTQLTEIAQGLVAEDDSGSVECPASALDAAAGLTRIEAENGFSLSIVRHGAIRAETIWELKAQTLKKNGLMTLHRGQETFKDIGGLDALKTFCRRALRPLPPEAPARPHGIMLLGVPGVGKSLIAKALGNEVGRPTLHLDVGSLMGSLVGETEANVRQVLRIADAMAPCILFVDEIEKALAGAAAGAPGDSGVSARLFGTLLTWLSDRKTDVFFIATANDVSRLPPEFTRAERFDGVFFLDLPSTAEKDAIWQMYLARYGLPPDQKRPQSTDWTGAEIHSCCRLASLLDLPLTAAAENVVPVAVTAAESVERLRKWASGRCLSATATGIYQHGPERSRGRRRVTRPGTDN